MSRSRNHFARPWYVTAGLAALVSGLYFLLPLAGVPIAVTSGLVAIVALKHLGAIAVLAAPLYAIARRWRRR